MISTVAQLASTSRKQTRAESVSACVAMVGNPNTGKTTLFNALTGLRSRTANFPGTTVEKKTGRARLGDELVEFLDLPGMYSMRPTTVDEQTACDVLLSKVSGQKKPDVVLLIVDATNLERNLFLASQVLALDMPVVIALNMFDLAEKAGMRIDLAKLQGELECPVVPIVAKTGRGLDELRDAVSRILSPDYIPLGQPRALPHCGACGTCPFQSRFEWTEAVCGRVVAEHGRARGKHTERIDRILAHPAIGVGVFATIMTAVFLLIFQVAAVPMDLIDALFARTSSWVEHLLPESIFRDLLVNGIIAGVGGILVFLPQICILFFFLTLLEDTGYLSRAAFVMDRLMRRIGLPGNAFVPLLSAHACAIPAIMGARVIRDWRDRLVTILIAPLMSCSARIPVYVMLTTLLFPRDPLRASLAFTGAYLLGVVASLGVAWAFKHTILPGETKPLAMELPDYRVPHLKTALLTVKDRAAVFIKQAGSLILLFSIALWFLATFPLSQPPAPAIALTEQAAALAAGGQKAAAQELQTQANLLTSQHALARSFIGRVGHAIEPLVAPLGYDWQIGIGILSSFAAREVIVATLAIVYGIGEDTVDDEPASLYDSLRLARRTDGTPVYNTATCVSLLVFYCLAMQCMATLAVTRRETRSWKWPLFQLAYMTVLAYSAAFITYQMLRLLGFAQA